jgi:hypothetical protein
VQASQTDVKLLTQAEPPCGAWHAAALDLMLGRVTPCDVVWQHATAPGLPQVERASQRMTAPRQLWFASDAFAAARAQLT